MTVNLRELPGKESVIMDWVSLRHEVTPESFQRLVAMTTTLAYAQRSQQQEMDLFSPNWHLLTVEQYLAWGEDFDRTYYRRSYWDDEVDEYEEFCDLEEAKKERERLDNEMEQWYWSCSYNTAEMISESIHWEAKEKRGQRRLRSEAAHKRKLAILSTIGGYLRTEDKTVYIIDGKKVRSWKLSSYSSRTHECEKYCDSAKERLARFGISAQRAIAEQVEDQSTCSPAGKPWPNKLACKLKAQMNRKGYTRLLFDFSPERAARRRDRLKRKLETVKEMIVVAKKNRRPRNFLQRQQTGAYLCGDESLFSHYYLELDLDPMDTDEETAIIDFETCYDSGPETEYDRDYDYDMIW